MDFRDNSISLPIRYATLLEPTKMTNDAERQWDATLRNGHMAPVTVHIKLVKLCLYAHANLALVRVDEK